MSPPLETRGPGTSLPSLTGLRWLAAALVFALHVDVVGYFAGRPQTVVSAVFGAGGTGVSLFFVLSGFVLAWSCEARLRARTFYRRRLARVWPAHAVFVLVAVVLSVLVVAIRHPGQSAASAVANLALLSAWVPGWSQAGNPVAWSLACEAFFYASFPLLWWGIRRLRAPRHWLVCAVVTYLAVWCGPGLLQLAHVVDSSSQASYHPLARIPEFTLGVIAASALRAGVWRGVRVRTALLVAVTTYVAASVLPGSRMTQAALTVAGSVLLVSALARADLDGVRTRLAGRVSVHLGAVSFAFYLSHLLVLGVLGACWPGGHPRLPLLPALALTLAAAALSLGCAELTHRWVEVPARRLLLERQPRRAGSVGSGRGRVAPPARRTRRGGARLRADESRVLRGVDQRSG